MIDLLSLLGCCCRGFLTNRATLIVENLALRHQLAVYRRTVKRPQLRPRDRVLWVCLSRLWRGWRCALVIVKPQTVVRWHRLGFRLYWRWKSRSGKVGRPELGHSVQHLIRRICRENPLWGAPRIQAELALLGHEIAESTVARYMTRPRKPPSPTWKSFLANHAREIVALDFFVVPTATFRLLYCFLVLSHDRRRVLHFNVTEHPTSGWTAQQLIEAFPFASAPRFALHDRDSIYGNAFKDRVKSLGLEEVITAPRSPWQNAYVERLIGSIRGECLDHVIVLNESHVKCILSSYFDYYHESRTHMGLGGNSPEPREVEPPSEGPSVPFPMSAGCTTATPAKPRDIPHLSVPPTTRPPYAPDRASTPEPTPFALFYQPRARICGPQILSQPPNRHARLSPSSPSLPADAVFGRDNHYSRLGKPRTVRSTYI